MSTALIASAGVLAGVLITLFVWYVVSTEKRIKRLEDGQTNSGRMTYHQQRSLEDIAFTFGHYLAAKEENEQRERVYLLNVYNQLGKLLDHGQNGEDVKPYSKASRKRLDA